MKKIYLFPLLAFSLPALSSPYLGLEMGQTTPHHNIKVFDTADKLTVSPNSDDIFLGLYAGYVLNKTWALESGYQQNQFTGSIRRAHQVETTLESKQFYLAPVYSLSLTNDRNWSLKFKAGATYTQYRFEGKKSEVFSGSKTSSDLGLMGSAGIEYQLTEKLGFGLNYKYQSDSYSSASSLALSANYYF
ncbi:porin family protein [Vibrio sp. 404]|uniref:Porin family protein n=1 Tax=Vibrio marinisediminis TaxID=2758441 RepID=A0A7W2FP29_9VIBR|nr:AcfA family outer membrane beta-barrel protein [Vibrio marinisediminis]MBA5761502.1 porin family protein [Vibrio marinisediminis]